MNSRNDERTARRWRGPLFKDFESPIAWMPKDAVVPERIQPPHYVAFPICQLCRHIIWNWPHFGEVVPSNAICDACADDELRHDIARDEE